ncbi:MAG: D-alanyl-D-alanine carboxypeptidase family protein [Pseudomonadales bacterium]|nr:D-alanyl-D-alanine carboxypeptidase family protein [Pseudomonadales bacterium]
MIDSRYRARIGAIHEALCIPADYEARACLPLYEEAQELADAGQDCFGREQCMTPATLVAWQALQVAAQSDGVELLLVSAYRSVDYQVQIFRRKLDSGQEIAHILKVNAAPGYSEHHTGRALDIGTPGSPVLEECFEQTDAFRWLSANAAAFGFSLSFPRDNPNGISYEPWHWCYCA